MRTQILLFSSIFMITPFLSFSQTCEQIKAELAKTKAENEYLKTSLKINTPIKTQQSESIEFKLLKVEGNSKAQTVTFTYTLTTNAANWRINSDVKPIIDIDGNEYKLKSYTLGSETYGQSIYLNTDVPIKCTYTYGGILPAVKIIKLFKYGYTHEWGEPYSVEFRDITINWL